MAFRNARFPQCVKRTCHHFTAGSLTPAGTADGYMIHIPSPPVMSAYHSAGKRAVLILAYLANAGIPLQVPQNFFP
ncbi:hypothetical protein D3C73_1254940 [compost metagenome]